MRAFLLGTIGLARTQLLWRALGLSAAIDLLYGYHTNYGAGSWVLSSPGSLPEFLAQRPLDLLAFELSGLALFLFGGRGLTLLLFGGVALLHTWTVATTATRFPAAELPLYFYLPLFALLVVALERGRDEGAAARRDAAIAWHFRLALVAGLLFSAFHKLNADFFDPEVSCTFRIAGLIQEAWGPAGEVLAGVASPALTVIAEAGLALLLLFAPRLGILGVAAFFLPLGLVAATRITSLMMLMSWSFLRPDEIQATAGSRRGLLFLALWAPLFAVSLAVYEVAVLPGEAIGLLEGLAVFGVVLVLLSFRAPRGEPGASEKRLGKPVRVLLGGALALFLLNGFSPYLGLKFNFSFAMWSNLRVDHLRWNSWVVPPWIRLVPAEDRMVEVTAVTVVAEEDVLFRPGPLRAPRFVRVIEQLTERGGFEVDLSVRQDDRELVFRGDVRAPELRRQLAELDDRKGALLEVLRARGRQLRLYLAKYALLLEPALFSTSRFRRVVEDLQGEGYRLDIAFRFAGRDRHYADALADDGFLAFVESLPELNLDPVKLDATGPQRCFH